jgi:hypothetical protein
MKPCETFKLVTSVDLLYFWWIRPNINTHILTDSLLQSRLVYR